MRFAIALVGAVALLFLAEPLRRAFRSWPERARVAGESMEPALLRGDLILVDPTAFARRPPRAGEIVVAPDPRDPARVLIKRVRRVEADGSLVLVGDRPDRSTDSRTFGEVDPQTVVGRPWLRYWPPARIARLS